MAGPITTGALFDIHSTRIQEILNKNVEVTLPSLDPMWLSSITSSQGVGSADAIGRDMLIRKIYQGAFTGVIEQARSKNDFVLYGDDTDETWLEKLYTQNLAQTFPDAQEGPNANPYRFACPMNAMVTNLLMTMGELQMEATPAVLGQVITPKLEGFARNIGHTLCNYWYVNENDDYKLCTIASPTAWVDNTTYWTATFMPADNEIDRFWVGQRIDIYDSTFSDGVTDDTQRKNETAAGVRTKLFVARVDELTGVVTIVTDADPEAGSDAWSDGADPSYDVLVAGDLVFYANTSHDDNVVSGFAGINSWVKSSGNILGGAAVSGETIDVDTHPEHKSASFDLSGAGLTEHTLRKQLRAFHRAKQRYGQSVDCLIASDGVWLQYEASRIGRETFERSGRLATIKNQGSDGDENFGGFQFHFDGKNYMGYTSNYIEDGTMYAIKKGGSNWKRYVPPSPAGTSKFGQAAPFIPFEFVAGAIAGSGTNRLPVYATGGANSTTLVTEGSQMPGMMRMQLMPDQFSGIKWTNIATDRVYSDT